MSCNGCGGANRNLIPVFDNSNESGKPTFVIEGPGINVEDLSDADAYRYRVSTDPFIDLTVALTMVLKESGVTRTSPILKGTILDEIVLTWSYNKVINSQTLLNTVSLLPPTLIAADVSKTYTGVSVTTAGGFTVSGNDGLGQPGSIASDSKTFSLGNYMYIGIHLNTKAGDLTSTLQAMLTAFSKSIKTSRINTYFATGGDNEYHYVAYPASYGLATFTKQSWVGGYVRLKNVGGTIKRELLDGDVESDISIANEKGFSEAYYVYESYEPAMNDPINPFVIS